MALGFRLTILEGPEKEKDYTFERIEITIGRTMENDVVLPDPGISRQHVSIRDKGGAYIIKDLGSSNGTVLNGKKILEEVLKVGDVISLGGAQIRFSAIGVSKTASPVRRADPERSKDRRMHKRQQVAPLQEKSTAPQQVQKEQVVIRSVGMRRKGQPRERSVAAAKKTGREAAGSIARKPQERQAGPLASMVAKSVDGFRGLNKGLQIAIISVAGLLLLLAALKLFKKGSETVRLLIDHSDDEFVAGQYDSGEALTYGLGEVKVGCRVRATFKFRYANGRATITYAVAGIDNKQEVTIELNGMLIGYAPITLGKWSDYIRLDLPRKHLLENEINRISFVNMVNYQNPDANESWAVEVNSIRETPLPPPDRDAALEAFKIAEQRYKTKGVAPPNLFRSLEFYRKARDYLEMYPEDSRPEIYHDASEMIAKIELELEKLFRDYLFEAEREKNRNRLDKAKDIYRRLMLVFPNPEDPLHLYTRRLFDEIVE